MLYIRKQDQIGAKQGLDEYAGLAKYAAIH